MIPPDARLLRIYLNASDRWQRKPLYQAVVEAARTFPLAGASVFLVDLSYGAHRRVRDSASEYASVDIPVEIEIVDAPERIEASLGAIGPMIATGFATVEGVRVLHYGLHAARESAVPPPSPGAINPMLPTEPTVSVEDRPMPLEGLAQRVTVYIGSSDTWHGRNLAMAIVDRCRTLGIAGATASLGVMGFGKHSRVHRAQLFGLSQDLPEKVEIVDRPERIAALLPVLEEMVEGGLIVLQDVRAIRYADHASRANV